MTVAHASSAMRAEAESAPRESKQRALISRGMDFWLLGGLSLFIWAAAHVGQLMRAESWAFNHHFQNLAAISGTLALVCNYPHFMASYKLAYGQGPRFVLQNWLQLIAVPLLITAACVAGYRLYGEPEQGKAIVMWLGDGLRLLGLATPLGTTGSAGKELMGLLVYAMYFTVGWHYSKQTFGCMMVYGNFDRLSLALWQRNALKWSLHMIWVASYVTLNADVGQRDFFGLPYHGLGFPAWAVTVAKALVWTGFVVIAGGVVGYTWKTSGRRPSVNFLVPWIAFSAWWIPGMYQDDFFYMLVPFFHSLQYLAFVYKVERTKLLEGNAETSAIRGGLLAIGLAVAGFATFEWIPNTLDVRYATHERLGVWFYFVCAWLFINIHHYFIDNVIWKFKNPHIRRYLLA